MKYTKEFSIDTFQFWGGAKDVVKHYAEKEALDDLEELILECFTNIIPTEETINYFVWFQAPEILGW